MPPDHWWDKQSTWSGSVGSPDNNISLGKWARTWNPVPGGNLVWVLHPCNEGSTASAGVIITETFPVSSTYLSWWPEASGWVEISLESDELVLMTPSLQAGECNSLNVRFKLDADLSLNTMIENRAVVYSASDLNPDDNEAISSVWTDIPHYDLALEHNWKWGVMVPGGFLEYELGFGNRGNVTVSGKTLTATLPANTTFGYSGYHDDWGFHEVIPASVAGNIVVWDLGNFENGEWRNLRVHLDIDLDALPGNSLWMAFDLPVLPGERHVVDNHIDYLDELQGYGPNLSVSSEEVTTFYWVGREQLNLELRVRNLGTVPLEDIPHHQTIPLSTTFNGIGG
jgi:uncharacterized repeat protein (TIGR01451 family)